MSRHLDLTVILVRRLGVDDDDLVAAVPHDVHRPRRHERRLHDDDDLGPPVIQVALEELGGEVADVVVGEHPLGLTGAAHVAEQVEGKLQVERVDLDAAGLEAAAPSAEHVPRRELGAG